MPSLDERECMKASSTRCQKGGGKVGQGAHIRKNSNLHLGQDLVADEINSLPATSCKLFEKRGQQAAPKAYTIVLLVNCSRP